MILRTLLVVGLLALLTGCSEPKAPPPNVPGDTPKVDTNQGTGDADMKDKDEAAPSTDAPAPGDAPADAPKEPAADAPKEPAADAPKEPAADAPKDDAK